MNFQNQNKNQKTRKLAFFLLFALYLGFPSVGQSDWAAVGAEAISIGDFPGPVLTQKELLELHRLESVRSEFDCKFGVSQVIPNFDTYFINPLHPFFTPEVATLVKGVVTKGMDSAGNVTGVLKKKYSRSRPLTEDSTLKPCAPTPKGNFSYPSGHSSMATAGACVIRNLFPERAEEVMAYAKQIANLRVLIGVHHPSDIVAGMSIGEQLCRLWEKDESFLREISLIREKLH